MKPAIRAEGLSKRYHVKTRRSHGPNNLTENLLATGRRLWQRLRGRGRADGDDAFWALRDVSFEVNPGEVVGVIGRNGAGKSTLLKVLSRIVTPTAGRAVVRGRLGSLLEVGTGFHPELSGRENIYLNGSVLGMSRREIDRKFDAIVAFSEVERFLDTPVKRYSSGMYVRLAFAVAAHLDPDILVVDEVLAVGDAAFQKKCLGAMQQASGAGRTVLFVSHHMPTVLHVCNRAILLDRGTCLLDSTPEAVVNRYLAATRPPASEVIPLGELPRTHSLRTNDNARLLAGQLARSPRPLWRGERERPEGDPAAPWELPYGEPLGLVLDVLAARDLGFLELGLALHASQGTEIASSLSCDALPLTPVAAGTYRFRVQYPGLVLAPGPYYFGLGLRSDHGMEDYLPEALWLTITPTRESAAAKVHLRRGSVIPNLSCEMSPWG